MKNFGLFLTLGTSLALLGSPAMTHAEGNHMRHDPNAAPPVQSLPEMDYGPEYEHLLYKPEPTGQNQPVPPNSAYPSADNNHMAHPQPQPIPQPQFQPMPQPQYQPQAQPGVMARQASPGQIRTPNRRTGGFSMGVGIGTMSPWGRSGPMMRRGGMMGGPMFGMPIGGSGFGWSIGGPRRF